MTTEKRRLNPNPNATCPPVSVWLASLAGTRVTELDSVVGMESVAADLEQAKRLDTLGQNAAEQAQTRSVWELDTPPSTLPAIFSVHEIRRDYIAGIVLAPETGRYAVRVLGLTRSPAP